jgi:mono/diheme cytochrome c family protein
MIYKSLINYLVISLLCMMSLAQNAQAQDAKKGKSLFLEKCAQCHNNDMKTKSTGPALGGVRGRWSSQPAVLYDWIRNSTAVIESGNAYAKNLYEEYDNSNMSRFPELNDEAIDDILAYVEEKAAGGGAVAAVGATTQATTSLVKKEEGTNYSLWILFGVLLTAVALLGRYVNSLNRLAQQRTGEAVDAPKSLLEIVLNPLVVKILIFGLVILGGYTTINNAIGLSRQQGYAPDQPIKFSHALHAGQQKIDCQYCHDGARRSKHGYIPPVSTCMNCHAAVKKGPQYGTAEILKIYAAAGFNPAAVSRDKYFFEATVTNDERMVAYKDYLEETYKAELEDNNTKNKIRSEIDKQLVAIKPMIGKPIEWVRIHNLPDHAYFNHSQHVVAGGVACQSCHGEVEKMVVVKQHAPLSMGWCINCHRQTKVKFEENGYYTAQGEADSLKQASGDYKSYEKYHQQINDKKRTGITVEEIGGLECQKCHY